MKCIVLPLVCTFFIANNIMAQRAADETIQDSVIGWWSNNRFDHLKPQTDALGKKKETIVNDMVKWMKTSYTPVGGLGTSNRYINKKNYGVQFLVWNVSHDKEWTDEKGNFKPIAEENTNFNMAANKLYGAYDIKFISSPTTFYFIMEQDGYAVGDQTMQSRKGADPRIHPNAYNYITWINELHTVYLAPNNKLPIIAVTKGELLDKAEEGLVNVLADEKKEVERQWPNSVKTQAEAFEARKKNIDKYRDKIHQLKERHKSTLNEPALVRDMQITMYSFETDPDIFAIDGFSNKLNNAYAVYKLDAATIEKMSSDVPQWIAVSFPYETKENGNQKFEMYTAMSQNINYEYIYNYFFDPEKIKGKAYTAANAGELKARLDGYRSTTSKNQHNTIKKQTNMPANVVLFDDFSQDAIGSKPAGWYFSNFGKANTVATINGENGNWLKLGYNNKLSSTTLKTLPVNFTFEFDIVTSNFSGITGAAIQLQLSGSKKGSGGTDYSSNMELNIVSGYQQALDENHNFRGEVRMSLINKPTKMDYNERGGYFKAPLKTFTNTQQKAHVKLVKKNGEITLFINDQAIATSTAFKTMYGKDCGDCSIPDGVQYSTCTLQNLTQDSDTVDCYIGNIKIVKD